MSTLKLNLSLGGTHLGGQNNPEGEAIICVSSLDGHTVSWEFN